MSASVDTSRGAPNPIAFLRMAGHPIPNRLLPLSLEDAFPDRRVDVIDLGALVRAEPLTWLVNPFFMLWEHGTNLLTGRIKPRQAFFTTTFLLRRMSRAGRRFVERGRYAFSFQIQSLFDGRSETTPHFVYTDHTHPAMRSRYSGFSASRTICMASRRRPTDRRSAARNSADRTRPCRHSVPPDRNHGQLNRAVAGPLQRFVMPQHG